MNNMNYWVMLDFQKSAVNIQNKFWCQLTIATTYFGKCGSLFWSKIYIDV